MLTFCHQSTDGGEMLEVALLTGHERPTFEVWNDLLEEILETARFPLERVVAPVWADASAPEQRLNRIQHLGSVSVLADGEASAAPPIPLAVCCEAIWTR
jgi:hypothetical protein